MAVRSYKRTEVNNASRTRVGLCHVFTWDLASLPFIGKFISTLQPASFYRRGMGLGWNGE